MDTRGGPCVSTGRCAFPGGKRGLTMLTPILDALEKHGMPVAFLRHVEAHVPLVASDTDALKGWKWDMQLHLSAGTLRPLANPVPDTIGGEAAPIHTLYHEGTHAFLYSKRAEPAVVRLREEALRYYRDAGLAVGGTATDPARIVEEAAADYVAHRAAMLWRTMEALAEAAEVERTAGGMNRFKLEEKVKECAELPHEYNRKGAQLVFGYQNNYWGYGSRQLMTTKPISFALKNYCDQVILQGKIPDCFDGLPECVRQHGELLGRLRRLLPVEAAATY